MEAFSPFIPLNAPDSALPATCFELKFRNTSKEPVTFSVGSWLENPVGTIAGEQGWPGKRRTQIARVGNVTSLVQSAFSIPEPDPSGERSTIVFASFEQSGWGEWRTEGTSFGDEPSSGTIREQGKVSGFQGKGVVNSFHGYDETTGRLISPTFTIERKFINFLYGGGDQPDRVGLRLIVGGEVVRQLTGFNAEKMQWRSWNVSEFEGKLARIEAFDDSKEPWGHVLLDQVEFADRGRRDEAFASFEEISDVGTLVWRCLDSGQESTGAGNAAEFLPEPLREFATGVDAAQFDLTDRKVGVISTQEVKLAPDEEHAVRYVLAWHFPNSVKPDRQAGHEYAARFTDASAVADYVEKHFTRLAEDTRKWRDTWYDSTLPVWLLDRIHWTASCLATGTAQWWKNGRFWAWEGVVCCEGTCTHVWNYAQSLARLFPELERNIRERQDLGPALQPSGLVGFRGTDVYAADGQCGTILKVWREHLLSPDDAFLKRNWENTQRALDFLIEQDANEDGLIENRQHNTYDINFYGANTFVGALYLAALRAGEEMAWQMGDMEYAARLRAIFDTGKRLTEERLWNGEYFTQDVDLNKHPEDQYGDGCLSDQLFGQNWAHQTQLGYLYDPAKVRTALESVWKYNWAPDTGVYNAKFPPERPFADATEPGLFICTWPQSKHLGKGVRYRDEVWTGIEYQVAVGMIYEGMIDEGLAICRAVHDRYHPLKRNPYNEIECSDFYARAMASWGVLLALSGFGYDGPSGELTFAPRYQKDHLRCAFTAAEGWGTLERTQKGNSCKYQVQVRQGKLTLRTLKLGYEEAGRDAAQIKPVVKVANADVPVTANVARGVLTLKFELPITVAMGDSVEVTLQG